MTVLDLPPEMEAKMQEVAQAEGLDVPTPVRETMAARLREYDPARGLTESELVEEINRDFSEAFWGRYRLLIARRRAETMTPEEQQEAIGMSDQLKAWRVERLQYLMKLAGMRHTSVDALMQEMGIRPVRVDSAICDSTGVKPGTVHHAQEPFWTTLLYTLPLVGNLSAVWLACFT